MIDEHLTSNGIVSLLAEPIFIIDKGFQVIDIDFTESKFKVTQPTRLNNIVALKVTFENFIRQKRKNVLNL